MGSQTFQAVTPKIIIFFFDSILEINIVKVADLKAHNASRSPLSCLICGSLSSVGVQKVFKSP